MNLDYCLYQKIMEEYIKAHEDCRLEAYTDTEGYPTIGWGHRMVKNEYKMISQAQADELFHKDLVEANFFILHLLPSLSDYSENRRMALMDMAYQLRGHLTHFPKAIEHVKAEEWVPAAVDFLDSIWARKQTSSRAIDNAILLIQG